MKMIYPNNVRLQTRSYGDGDKLTQTIIQLNKCKSFFGSNFELNSGVNVKKDPRTNILVHLIIIEKKFNYNFEKCFWPNCEGCGNLMPIKYYDTTPEDTTGIECALVKPEFRKTEQSLEIGEIIERKY